MKKFKEPDKNTKTETYSNAGTGAANTSSDKKPVPQKIKSEKTSITKLKTAGKKAFVVKWKKKKDISGYQVQYARNKKFTKGKKTKNIAKAKTTSVTIRKLKSKKTYYVRVRTYKKVKGKKYYSAWSKVKHLKIR